MEVEFGDLGLRCELPDALSYHFRDNGALMAYVSDNDSLNIHISSITVTPKDPVRYDLIFDRIISDAKEKGLDSEIIDGDKSVYKYSEDGSWEDYYQRILFWHIGYGNRQIIITASCLIDHPDFASVQKYISNMNHVILSIKEV